MHFNTDHKSLPSYAANHPWITFAEFAEFRKEQRSQAQNILLEIGSEPLQDNTSCCACKCIAAKRRSMTAGCKNRCNRIARKDRSKRQPSADRFGAHHDIGL